MQIDSLLIAQWEGFEDKRSSANNSLTFDCAFYIL